MSLLNILNTEYRSLKPNKWVSNKVINYYFRFIRDNYSSIVSMDLHCIQSGLKFLHKVYILKRKRKPNARFAIFPIDAHNHYTFMYYDINNKKLYSLNSFHSKVRNTMVSTVFEMLKEVDGINKIIDEKNCSLQTDGNNCGVFLCGFANQVVHNNINFNVINNMNDINLIRLNLLNIIAFDEKINLLSKEILPKSIPSPSFQKVINLFNLNGVIKSNIKFKRVKNFDQSKFFKNETKSEIKFEKVKDFDPSKFFKNETKIEIKFKRVKKFDPSKFF